MKPLFTSILLLCSGVLIAAAREAAPAQKLRHTTMKDLDSAMHGEAFAYAKYMLFAHHARQSGHPEIARLFEDAAQTERMEHFAEEAKLANLVGDDAQNLADAIRGESYEVDHMYADFAKQAAAAGDAQAAQRFEEIRNDERKHRDAFQAALDKLAGRGLSGGK